MKTLSLRHVLLLIAGCALLPSSSPLFVAPPPPPSGFLLGSPVGITSERDPSIRIKCAGFDDICMDTPVLPDFSMIPSVWLSGSSWNPALHPAPILAMTIGIDLIAVTTNDEMTLNPPDKVDGASIATPLGVAVVRGSVSSHGWMALEFSVHPDPNDTSKLAPDIQAANVAGELDRSVFSYLIWGDADMLPDENHHSVRAMDPAALGLDSSADKIHGLNMHMAMYRTDLGAHPSFFTRPLPKNPTIYFTLRPEFTNAMGNDPKITARFVRMNSATIYMSTWTGSTWTDPVIHRELSGLSGLTTSSVIDGLAIDLVVTSSGTTEKMMFSTAEAALNDQIQYVRFDNSITPPPIRRVVVEGPPGTNTYGSLGTVLGGGRGIGDFCTKDPTGDNTIGINVLDDFEVARRLRQRDGSELSVASYRQLARARDCCCDHIPIMRSCMSSRVTTVPGAIAIVQFGVMDSFKTITLPIKWLGTKSFTYTGTPLTADYPLPDRDLQGKRAMVAQWWVRDARGVYASPLSALRF